MVVKFYSITSLKNWDKYEDTGDSEYLNDIKEEELREGGKFMLAWEGGAVKIEIK